MKLRVKGNSIRFRLLQSEVQSLGNGNSVVEFTVLNGACFSYQLTAGQAFDAQLLDGTLSISIPETVIVQWAGTEEIGIYHTFAFGDESLSLSVEKDFTCLKAREGEDVADNFPNPQAPQ